MKRIVPIAVGALGQNGAHAPNAEASVTVTAASSGYLIIAAAGVIPKQQERFRVARAIVRNCSIACGSLGQTGVAATRSVDQLQDLASGS